MDVPYRELVNFVLPCSESREVTPVSKEKIDKLAAAWLSTLQPTLVGLQHKIVQLIDKQSAIADDLEKQNNLVSHVTDNVSLQGLTPVETTLPCALRDTCLDNPALCTARHLLRQPCPVHCETPVETTLPCALREHLLRQPCPVHCETPVETTLPHQQA
uniref:Uncharacterized protein n=1 Tax=Timema tahoe TaxID=61484 RepID=A0A7R9FH53_9NEOP|nr:unnamed protein product [Timema tahoe]